MAEKNELVLYREGVRFVLDTSCRHKYHIFAHILSGLFTIPSLDDNERYRMTKDIYSFNTSYLKAFKELAELHNVDVIISEK